ncbi:hypothetical protein SISNIDRAFT_466715 [Sistotremastrum niveocremeum HHB9708]|uniref:Uncharacterized protein n=1 Tax=Sistotremastrum niveocremeum HHB9708 TaxID=1314777 RepID=A0A164U2H2_9AGAM|nr:hypothetical protein SISNIDRAFT_466715 [Sistotremastrum niveocremeum HHB9708]
MVPGGPQGPNVCTCLALDPETLTIAIAGQNNPRCDRIKKWCLGSPRTLIFVFVWLRVSWQGLIRLHALAESQLKGVITGARQYQMVPAGSTCGSQVPGGEKPAGCGFEFWNPRRVPVPVVLSNSWLTHSQFSNGIPYAVTLLKMPKGEKAPGAAVAEFRAAFVADFGEPEEDGTIPYQKMRSGISAPNFRRNPDKYRMEHGLKSVAEVERREMLTAEEEEVTKIEEVTVAKIEDVDEPALTLEANVRSRERPVKGESPVLISDDEDYEMLAPAMVPPAQALVPTAVQAQAPEQAAYETVAWGLAIPLHLPLEIRTQLREAAEINDMMGLAQMVVNSVCKSGQLTAK